MPPAIARRAPIVKRELPDQGANSSLTLLLHDPLTKPLYGFELKGFGQRAG